MDSRKTLLCWSELHIGDFFLDVGFKRHNYCLKLSKSMYFDLEDNRIHRRLKVPNEMPRYFICDYEVW